MWAAEDGEDGMDLNEELHLPATTNTEVCHKHFQASKDGGVSYNLTAVLCT